MRWVVVSQPELKTGEKAVWDTAKSLMKPQLYFVDLSREQTDVTNDIGTLHLAKMYFQV